MPHSSMLNLIPEGHALVISVPKCGLELTFEAVSAEGRSRPFPTGGSLGSFLAQSVVAGN
jgi:hypothetical protein